MIFKNISIVKYLVVTLAMLMIGSTITFAQATVKLPIATGIAGETTVSSVTIEGLTGGVASGQARIYVADSTVAKIVDVTAAGLSEGGFFSKKIQSGNEVRLSWAQQEDITGSNVLFNISVEYLSVGSTTITTVNPADASQTLILGSLASGTIATTVTDGILSVPNVNVTIPTDITGTAGAELTIPVNTTAIAEAEGVSAYNFSITFNKDVMSLSGVSLSGTLSEGGIASQNIDNDNGTATIAVASSGTISGEGVLLNLVGNVVGKGTSDIAFTGFTMSKLLGGTIVPGTFAGKVTVANVAPVLAPIEDVSGSEGVEVAFTVSATDANNDVVTLSLLSSNLPASAASAFDADSGKFAWTPGYGDAGVYTVKFKADDGDSGVDSSDAVTITIANVNRNPVLNAVSAITVAEGEDIAFTLVATDADVAIDDTLKFSSSNLPTGATLDELTGAFAWTPGFDQAGSYDIVFTVTDLSGADSSQTASITVTNVNGAPSWNVAGAKQMPDTIAIEGIKLEYTYKAIDPEDDALRYRVIAPSPADATIDLNTGLFSWTPPVGSAGNYAVQIAADDQVNSAVLGKISIVTVQADKAPTVTLDPVDESYTVVEGGSVAFSVTAADEDVVYGDAVSLAVTGDLASKYTAASSTSGSFSWTTALGDAGTYSVVFTATDLAGKTAVKTVNVVVTKDNMAPVFTAELGDTTLNVGSTLTFDYDATDANPGDTALVYSLVGEFPGAAINTSTGELTWTLSAASTMTYNLVVVVSDGSLADTSKAAVTVFVPTYTVSGMVKYHNTAMTPVSSVVATIGSSMDTTGSDGAFAFAGLVDGSYSVAVSKTGGWGGVLASDALAAALFFVDSANHPLDAMQKMAADVNADGSILSSDALIILNRVVGKINSFDIPDWLFSPASVDLTVSKDTMLSFSAIAAGDANGSYVPGLAKKSVNYVYGKDINFSTKGEMQLPIRISSSEEIGAFTLRIPYPTDKLEFISANSAANIITKDSEGMITIAWADLSTKNPLVVEDKDELVTLTFRAVGSISESEMIEFRVEEGSEVVDRFAKDISSGLIISKISKILPDEFELAQNYPNPFNPSTLISYSLPVEGKVNLAIYNAIGQVVATLVDNVQEAGSYDIEWNASNLSSGIYFYRITVEGNKSFIHTKKMLLLK